MNGIFSLNRLPIDQRPALADPFVFHHEDRYWAIGTGHVEMAKEAGPFPAYTSLDLVHWQDAGSLQMPFLGEPWIHYWAPEIAYHDGLFYLYFALGASHEQFEIRVATSATPLGPYQVHSNPVVDPKRHGFAIDAHPFQDEDGLWYLYYAFDDLDSDRPGTVLGVASLVDMVSTGDDERIVSRAQHDWQRFEKDRRIYGGVRDWHTLEGPSVIRHEGQIYCFYSGGNWQNESYGVDYLVASNPLGPYIDDNEEGVPRVLRSIPGQVAGPGHNSLIRDQQGDIHIAYHAWDSKRHLRRFCIDKLSWTQNGPRCQPTIGEVSPCSDSEHDI